MLVRSTVSTVLLRSIAVTALCLAAHSAIAQTPATADTTTTPVAAPATTVDESALRYFARLGDKQRFDAEAARLAAIYPGWEPPADPLAAPDTVDHELQAIWDIYGTGDIPALKAAILERQSREPGWQPPQDLADAVRLADVRTEIVTASDAKDEQRVLRLAATYPQLLECPNMDLLWRVGEAFVGTKRQTRGMDMYSYILTNCDKPDERLATVQKAAVLLPYEEMKPLFEFEKPDAATGLGEFEPVRISLARDAVSAVLDGNSRRADPDLVTHLAAFAEATPTVDDLQLLGYYELNQEHARAARDWFRQAHDIDANLLTSTGLATALLELRDAVEAEEVLADFRSETPETEQLYLGIAANVLSGRPPQRVDEEVLERISEVATDARDATVAHNLGWYAYNFGQYRTAAQWFEEALSYNRDYEAAAYGLVVASNQFKDTARIRELKAEWGDRSPRIRLFGQRNAPTEAPARYDLLAPRAVFQPTVFRIYQDEKPTAYFMLTQGQSQSQIRSSAQCGTYVPPETLSDRQAISRAWCLMDINRDAEAEETFRRATRTTSTSIRTEAYYGQALALLRLGLPNEAAVAAAAMPQSAKRTEELQVAILTDTALDFYNIGKYDEALQALDLRSAIAPEQNDLLVIRAWSYFHLGAKGQARRIFEAVAATGNADAKAGLDAIGNNWGASP